MPRSRGARNYQTAPRGEKSFWGGKEEKRERKESEWEGNCR